MVQVSNSPVVSSALSINDTPAPTVKKAFCAGMLSFCGSVVYGSDKLNVSLVHAWRWREDALFHVFLWFLMWVQLLHGVAMVATKRCGLFFGG